mmetsp:Transcript_32455/g.49652  ORF Transcript_32455/g.49652 Transcript_32455/m.49652 type:complete len:407 (-) Transcript_32455:591-1811(-)
MKIKCLLSVILLLLDPVCRGLESPSSSSESTTTTTTTAAAENWDEWDEDAEDIDYDGIGDFDDDFDEDFFDEDHVEDVVVEEEEHFEPFLGYPESYTKTPFELNLGSGIESYLNGNYRTIEMKHAIAKKLRAGNLVVLKNAFLPEFAQRMHEELWDSNYTAHQDYIDDGFTYHHHNVYDLEDQTDYLKSVVELFRSKQSRDFMHQMTGRDTHGFPSHGAPSHYVPWDYSMAHADYFDQRTVTYVWHLTKSWRPEWGGGLYWCRESTDKAYTPASFNTLFLFIVSPDTQHFVTLVSPLSQGKRLAFNGWWESDWLPDPTVPGLTEYLADATNREQLTAKQLDTLMELNRDLMEDPPENPGLRKVLNQLWEDRQMPSLYTTVFEHDQPLNEIRTEIRTPIKTSIRSEL